MTLITRLFSIGVLLATVAVDAGATDAPGPDMLRARRERVMDAMPNSLVLIRATPSTMTSNQNGFRQNRDFLYLTGLTNAVGALLLIDSERRESWLFAPAPGEIRAPFLSLMRPPYGFLDRSTEAVARLGVDHVVSWNDFAGLLDRRLEATPGLAIVGPFRDKPVLGPDALTGQSEAASWEQTLRARWPRATFKRGPDLRAFREVKDAGEILALRRAAKTSGAALLAGLRGLRPGRRQREAETDVVAACVGAGGDRISFWPWVMAGENSSLEVAALSMADSSYRDRSMRSGELVRVDVGCTADEYEGDVGRTAPVSGRFDEGQREAWDLFVAAYRAGMREMRPGRTSRDVLAAWRAEFGKALGQLKTNFGRRAATVALAPDGAPNWQIHGVGLDSAEGLIDAFRVGQVFAYEPIITVDGVGLYLEDMILMTERGPEVLSAGLPYSASEIERLMGAR